MGYNERLLAVSEELRRADVLRKGLDLDRYARALLEKAEDDEEYFEVRGFHTRSGNPYTFRI